MKRYLWALGVWWLVWLGFVTSAGALELHVCVRPPDVPANVSRWAYDSERRVIVRSEEEFRRQSEGKVIFVYDPQAPPQSVEFLPAKHQHLVCPGAKPAAPAKPPPSASAAPSSPPKPAGGEMGSGGKGAGGEKKTAGEKVAAELAVAGAIATGQMNEDLKNPAGKKYGIPGGKNANGPNHPVAQAAAGVTLIALGVLSPDKFAAKLKDAVAKKTPLLLSATTLTKDGIEKLLKKHGAHALADAMWVNGTVGPYSVMQKFTARLGGAYQAHHLIEQRFVTALGLGTVDSGLCVILKDAEHKALTKKLLAAIDAKAIRTPADLWRAYQTAYVDHPHWLEAIKPYLIRAK